ncbi:ribonuclease HII [Erysipelotrichaceae bacterium 51-3]|uniref:ribonuclease HII n=1 Tax=Allobaculum sp. JKK-2023 TaxID=3108943 RepID=UPI002B0608A9|nr:ribonuclease HII [Allobaculum sp. JKK-2023]
MQHPSEEALWPDYPVILGMDEAGRGPICGPLVVAGVIFPAGYTNDLINDSKKLSEKKREALFEVIQKDALKYWVLFIDEPTIDRLNIYRATQQAMEKIASLAGADYVLTDAMPLTDRTNFEALVKGDQKSLAIAAASILAKVSRDHYMIALDKEYPQYGLKDHKGYPTRRHLDAIAACGIQDFYRRSYGPVAKIIEENNRLTLF